MRIINKVVVGDVENLKNYKVWRVLYTDARGLYNKIDDNLYTYKDAEEVCHIAIDDIGEKNVSGFLITAEDDPDKTPDQDIKHIDVILPGYLLDTKKDNNGWIEHTAIKKLTLLANIETIQEDNTHKKISHWKTHDGKFVFYNKLSSDLISDFKEYINDNFDYDNISIVSIEYIGNPSYTNAKDADNENHNIYVYKIGYITDPNYNAVYTDFKTELKNMTNSIELKKFFMALDKSDDISKYDDIIEKAQKGYCEDLAVYFYFKYKDIKIININRKHHVMYYDGLYYDSKTLNGVKEIKEIPFFKNTDIVEIHKWDESELPAWYKEKWDILNNKGVKHNE